MTISESSATDIPLRRRPRVQLLGADFTADPLVALATEAIYRRRKYWPAEWAHDWTFGRQSWLIRAGGAQEAQADIGGIRRELAGLAAGPDPSPHAVPVALPWAPWTPAVVGRPAYLDQCGREHVYPSISAVWKLARDIADEAREKPDPAGYVVFVTPKRLLDAGREECDSHSRGAPRTGITNFDAAPQEVRSGAGREVGSKRPDRVYPLCVSPFPDPLAAVMRADLLEQAAGFTGSRPTVRKRQRALGATLKPEGIPAVRRRPRDAGRGWREEHGVPHALKPRPEWVNSWPCQFPAARAMPDEPLTRQEAMVPSDASAEAGYRGPGTYRPPWHWQPDGPRVHRVECGMPRDPWYELTDLGTVLDPRNFEGWDPDERVEQDKAKKGIPTAGTWVYGGIRGPGLEVDWRVDTGRKLAGRNPDAPVERSAPFENEGGKVVGTLDL